MRIIENSTNHGRTALDRVTHAVAQLRLHLGDRGRLIELTRINRTLTAINRELDSPRRSGPSAATIEALQRVGARVAREIADPPDAAVVDAETAARYHAFLARLIRSYAATESMLDDGTLDRLDWFTQEIRLEYLSARLAAQNAISTNETIAAEGGHAMRGATSGRRPRSGEDLPLAAAMIGTPAGAR